MKTISLILKGILMGVANIIPGVSGGTIAVVLRVFDEMIDAINNFYRRDFIKHMKFLIPLFLGALIGIGAFSKIIKFSLEGFSLPTSMFFVGLVVGSIPLIYAKAKEKGIKPKYYIAAFIGFAVVVVFSLLKEPESAGTTVAMSAGSFIKLLCCGILASSAMVIPGISGSFVMVLLGIYTKVITAVSDMIDQVGIFVSSISTDGFFKAAYSLITSQAFFVIAAVGIGVVLGIVIISKIIEILLEKAYSYTYFAILGLIFGSIFSIFKDPITYQSYSNGIAFSHIIAAIVCCAVGIIISLILGKE